MEKEGAFLAKKDLEQIEDMLGHHGYSIIEPMGSGGFGSIYRVNSRKYPNQTFVCKVSKNRKTFDLELSILTKSDHQNIVRCYDFFNNGNYFILIEEDCTRGNLYDMVKEKGPIPPNLLSSYAYQLIEALAFLHGKRIAHLDIKPNNIFIDRYGRPKLGDFGLSRKFPDSDVCTNYSGTHLYMCPELVYKKPFDPFKADIWALGMTLYYAMVGKNVVRTNSEFYAFIQTGYFLFPNYNYPNIMKTIINSCIQVRQESRKTAKELLHQFKSEIKNSKQLINMSIIPSHLNLANSAPKIFRPMILNKPRNPTFLLSKSKII